MIRLSAVTDERVPNSSLEPKDEADRRLRHPPRQSRVQRSRIARWLRSFLPPRSARQGIAEQIDGGPARRWLLPLTGKAWGYESLAIAPGFGAIDLPDYCHVPPGPASG